MENASLEPTGILSLRLNQSVAHIMNEAKNKDRCALHYWSTGIRYEVQIMARLSFNITLCTKCYGLFHRLQDLNSMKHRINNYILNDIERAGR